MVEPKLARIIVAGALLTLLTSTVSCGPGWTESNDVIMPYTELVMPVGSTVRATNANGTISIFAKSTEYRIYRWNGREATVGLTPRGPNRWYGSLGIYALDADRSGPGWSERIQPEEYQIHFEDLSSAQSWLKESDAGPIHSIWNNTGLHVAYSEFDGQLHIRVAQVCIRGKKPLHVPGADDRRVTIVGKDGRPTSTLPCRNPGKVDNYSTGY
jgi:hypothetical protein